MQVERGSLESLFHISCALGADSNVWFSVRLLLLLIHTLARCTLAGLHDTDTVRLNFKIAVNHRRRMIAPHLSTYEVCCAWKWKWMYVVHTEYFFLPFPSPLLALCFFFFFAPFMCCSLGNNTSRQVHMDSYIPKSIKDFFLLHGLEFRQIEFCFYNNAHWTVDKTECIEMVSLALLCIVREIARIGLYSEGFICWRSLN